MQKKRVAALLSAAVLALSMAAAGCSNDLGDKPQSAASGGEGTDSSIPTIEILVQGWVNTPTDENDPFKKYMDEKYGVNMVLTATSDFANQVSVKFASDSQPDIVSFGNMTDFNKLYEQGSLLADWTPYVEQMSNFKQVYSVSETTQKMFTEDGRLRAIWTLPENNVWSLKIRKDWLENLNLDPPETPEDLLEIARAFTFNDPDGNGEKDTYGFTEGGAGQNFNVLGQWTPYMFGDIMYVEGDQVVNGITKGYHKDTLDFIRTIVSEELIDPNWYVQTWSQMLLHVQGKVGIMWYPGVLIQDTDVNNGNEGATVDWWETYPVPKADNGAPYAGLMPADAACSHILSVSARSALDKNKMDKIVQILDDVMATPDGKRPETYDALRWGIGVEEGHTLIPIEGTDQVYTSTANPDKQFYWEKIGGGWDWGCWFNIPNTDGVINGTQPEPSDITKAVARNNAKAISFEKVPSLNMLSLDAGVQDKLNQMQYSFEYQYVKGKTDDYDGFVKSWKEQGGDSLLQSAKEQLTAMGIM